MPFWPNLSSLRRPHAKNGGEKHGTSETPGSKAGKKARVDSIEDFDLTMASSHDSCDEPPLPAPLNWRHDPQLSTWRIDVATPAGVVDTYYVDKVVLNRKDCSKYFQSLFADHVVETGSSRFEFPDKAAMIFPQLLDYIYSPTTLRLSTKSAAAFYFLGKRFGIEHLFWKAKHFWKQDLSFETVAIYYEDAIIFHDDQIMNAVLATCEDPGVLLKIKVDSPILQVPDPKLWLLLLQKISPSHSEHMSKLVASYCSRHLVDADTFMQLTEEDLMPVVSWSVALGLLGLECDILRSSNDEGLSSLQYRCIKALAKTWDKMDVSKVEFTNFLEKQSPNIVTELFKQSLTAAQTRLRVLEGLPVTEHEAMPLVAEANGFRAETQLQSATSYDDNDVDQDMPTDEPDPEEAEATEDLRQNSREHAEENSETEKRAGNDSGTEYF